MINSVIKSIFKSILKLTKEYLIMKLSNITNYNQISNQFNSQDRN